MASENSYLSSRAERYVNVKTILVDLLVRAGQNPFHLTDNPKGIINFSTAQNTSLSPVIIEKLNQPGFMKWDEWMLPYTEKPCLWRLREAVAGFLTEQTGAKQPLDPKMVLIVNGVTALISLAAFVLCDDGDTILTPSPMYGAIPRDLSFVSNVHTYPVHLSSKAGRDGSEPFELTVDLLEETLREAQEKGHKVKALFLVNPNNPLGIVYTKEQVLTYMEFCKRHELHCVIDEIYLCCIYDQSVPNSSALGFDPEEIPDIQRTHVMWGFSKDFGMPGSPVAALYTWNNDVFRGVAGLADFHAVPSYNQEAAAKLLEDRDWLHNVCLQSNLDTLKEHAEITMATLDEMDVPYVKPSAGLFIWLDLRKFMSTPTPEEEMRLAEHFLDQGVVVPPGAGFFYDEHGWFRIVFAVPKYQLVEGLKRVKAACLSFENKSGKA
ncbi:1-aminocyclopropane-1-carboxylate synthase-like protein 1 [Diadema setosum]|uniref:1-aminocyclopropane-1-carboxylate synthase-like protein 1 n=1 Tax=Diadema setosum TaxID=31175 RepID=UPI003B3B1109